MSETGLAPKLETAIRDELLQTGRAERLFIGFFNSQQQMLDRPIIIMNGPVGPSSFIDLRYVYDVLFSPTPFAGSAMHVLNVEQTLPGEITLRAILMRQIENGPFEPGTQARVQAVLNRLQASMHPGADEKRSAANRRHVAPWALVLTDEQLCVQAFWSSRFGRDLLGDMRELPAFIARPLRLALSSWDWDQREGCRPVVLRPIPEVVVRVTPVMSKERVLAALIVEGRELRDPVASAVREYRISPREVQILRLLFIGYRDSEIARELSLALSTIHDHVKHVVAKTHARSRLEMAARILGWHTREN